MAGSVSIVTSTKGAPCGARAVGEHPARRRRAAAHRASTRMSRPLPRTAMGSCAPAAESVQSSDRGSEAVKRAHGGGRATHRSAGTKRRGAETGAPLRTCAANGADSSLPQLAVQVLDVAPRLRLNRDGAGHEDVNASLSIAHAVVERRTRAHRGGRRTVEERVVDAGER